MQASTFHRPVSLPPIPQEPDEQPYDKFTDTTVVLSRPKKKVKVDVDMEGMQTLFFRQTQEYYDLQRDYDHLAVRSKQNKKKLQPFDEWVKSLKVNYRFKTNPDSKLTIHNIEAHKIYAESWPKQVGT